MKLFARVVNNVVTTVANTETDAWELETFFRVPQGNTILLVNIDGVIPEPQVGWTYNPADGTFSA